MDSQLITLAPNECALFVADLDALSGQLDACLSVLSEEEQSRRVRFVNATLQNRFALSHGFLRYVLAQYLPVAPKGLQFVSGEHGKPAILESHSKDLMFNLSHSKNKVVVAVTEQAEVGVDIEFCDPGLEYLPLARRFFSDNEFSVIEDSKKSEQPGVFFRTWSAKEAFIKSIGLGLSMPLGDFSVAVIEEPFYFLRLPLGYQNTVWSWFSSDEIPHFSLVALVNAQDYHFSLKNCDKLPFSS